MLWLAMVLVPFNAAMVGLVAITIHIWRHRKADWSAVHSYEKNGRLHVDLVGTGPILAGTLVFAGASLLGAFGFALCCGMSPSVPAMNVAWVVVILLSGTAAVRVWRLKGTDYFDVILDCRRKTLTVPAISNGQIAIVIPFGEIASIAVIEVPKPEDQTAYRLVVNWQKAGEGAQEIKITEYNDKEGAERFATWLRERIF